jgi:hypothetical protein
MPHYRGMATNAIAEAPITARPPLTERDAAGYLNCSPALMRLMRQQGRGPAYLRLGRLIRYEIPDLDHWRQRHRVTTRDMK